MDVCSRDRLIRSGCGAARGQPGRCNEDEPGRNLQCRNKKPPRRVACWLGDQLELWPLPFGRLFARRVLARLYVVGPCLQRDAPPLDHLAVPTGQFRLVADPPTAWTPACSNLTWFELSGTLRSPASLPFTVTDISLVTVGRSEIGLFWIYGRHGCFGMGPRVNLPVFRQRRPAFGDFRRYQTREDAANEL